MTGHRGGVDLDSAYLSHTEIRQERICGGTCRCRAGPQAGDENEEKELLHGAILLSVSGSTCHRPDRLPMAAINGHRACAHGEPPLGTARAVRSRSAAPDGDV